MTEAIAPEKGRGYYAHSCLVYAEVRHHAAYDHIDVLSSVIEEQIHNYEAPQHYIGVFVEFSKICCVVAISLSWR